VRSNFKSVTVWADKVSSPEFSGGNEEKANLLRVAFFETNHVALFENFLFSFNENL
jgi:hypothetical protein